MVVSYFGITVKIGSSKLIPDAFEKRRIDYNYIKIGWLLAFSAAEWFKSFVTYWAETKSKFGASDYRNIVWIDVESSGNSIFKLPISAPTTDFIVDLKGPTFVREKLLSTKNQGWRIRNYCL